MDFPVIPGLERLGYPVPSMPDPMTRAEERMFTSTFTVGTDCGYRLPNAFQQLLQIRRNVCSF
jgi:hypothetical protein